MNTLPTDKKKQDLEVGFGERNISRWAGAWGVRSQTVDGQVERILERRDARGNVTSRLRIGAVGFDGKMHLLAFKHKKMWNLIERLADRQGYPVDNWIEISSVAFYDFLIDIKSMDDPNRRKFRHASKYANSVYNLLMVIAGTPWFFEDWETRAGDEKVWTIERINLIEKIEIFGKTKNAQRGKIRIKIDRKVMAGLRAHHTTPILHAVQNSIKSDTAGTLYGYLSQILYKQPDFTEDVYALADRLKVGSEGHVVRDIRRAAAELQGLYIAYKNLAAKIVECRVEKRGREHVFFARRELPQSPKKIRFKTDLERAREAERQRIHDAQVERSEYLKRFHELAIDERELMQKEIDAKLAELTEKQLQMGRLIHEENAIIEAMERKITEQNDQLAGRICAPETMAREPAPVPYLSRRERALYAALARAIKQVGLKRGETTA